MFKTKNKVMTAGKRADLEYAAGKPVIKCCPLKQAPSPAVMTCRGLLLGDKSVVFEKQ